LKKDFLERSPDAPGALSACRKMRLKAAISSLPHSLNHTFDVMIVKAIFNDQPEIEYYSLKYAAVTD
jgi:hypothetical protein